MLTSYISLPIFVINIAKALFSISEKSKAKRSARYVDDLDLQLLDLSVIIAATNNLSEVNKIGEGGFGY